MVSKRSYKFKRLNFRLYELQAVDLHTDKECAVAIYKNGDIRIFKMGVEIFNKDELISLVIRNIKYKSVSAGEYIRKVSRLKDGDSYDVIIEKNALLIRKV